MSLVNKLKYFVFTNQTLSAEAIQFIVLTKLFYTIPTISDFQMQTIQKTFVQLYGEESLFVLDKAFDVFKKAKKICIELGFTNSISYSEASLFYYVFEHGNFHSILPNSREVLKILIKTFIRKHSCNIFEQEFNDVTSLSEAKSKSLSNMIYMSVIRAQEIISGFNGEVFYFNYMCGRDHNFCKKHNSRTFHLNEIIKLKNESGLLAMFLCGAEDCSGHWLANPFAR